MKASKFIATGLTLLLISGLVGCSEATWGSMTNDALNAKYPPIAEASEYMLSQPLTMQGILEQSPIVLEVELSALPKDRVMEFPYDPNSAEANLAGKGSPEGESGYSVPYVEIVFRVIRSLVPESPGQEVKVLVPKRNAAFAEVLQISSRYIVCLFPATNLGEDCYDTITGACLFVSDSEQVVPFDGSMRQEAVMGMSVNEFQRYVLECAAGE